MIEFSCPSCAKHFRVPDEYAGRSAKCKGCGGAVTVPRPAPAAEPAPCLTGLVGEPAPPAVPPSPPSPPSPPPAVSPSPEPRLPMRTRRLMADAQAMADALRRSDVIKILATEGDPPDVYRLEYLIRSLAPGEDVDDEPTPRDVHQVEIRLTADYPRMAPKCKMLTPVYHPNIDPSHICVGDHWTAGERLVDLVVRIGEMLAYQAYNIRSPLDAHAAMWADLNADKLPTDARTVRPAELE
jgi:ubiquitin-protein ligase